MSSRADIKPYLKTKLGSIPSDWRYKRIDEFIKEYRGGASLTPADFTELGVKVLPKAGVVRGGKLVVSKERQQYCSQQYAEANAKSLVGEEYLIVVLRDLVPSGPNIGLTVRIPSNESFILAQGVYGIIVDEKKLNSSFLVQLSNCDWYRKYVRRIMVGSTQVHIRNSDYKEMAIPYPPPLEQHKIAEILSCWDRAIEKTEQLIQAKQKLKKGLVQQLLTEKRRFGQFTGQTIEKRTIGQIATTIYGKSPNSIRNDQGKYKIYGTGGVVGRSNQFIYDKPAIIIGRKGTIDRPQLVHTPFWAIDTTFYCVPRDGIQVEWLYYKLATIPWRKYNEASGVPSLSRNTLEHITLLVPEFEEQTKISATLSCVDSYLGGLTRLLSGLIKQKKGLMQKLLTGQIRIKV